MPIIGALLGAVMMGVVYWIMWGGGLAYIDARISARQDAKRREADARRRIESAEAVATAPLRSLADPREGAVVLLCALALARGEPTPEQLTAIAGEMREVLSFKDASVEARLGYCRFAAAQAAAPEATIDVLAPLLRDALEPAEREELRGMLERVAALHGGPTERQERFVALAMRRVGEPASALSVQRPR